MRKFAKLENLLKEGSIDLISKEINMLTNNDISITLNGKMLCLDIIASQADIKYGWLNELKIGCTTLTIDYWKTNYKDIGNKHGYSEKAIAEYKLYIQIIEVINNHMVKIVKKQGSVWFNKYFEILQKDVLTYNEVKAVYHKLNKHWSGKLEKLEKQKILELINNKEYLLTYEQNKKGYEYIYNKYKSPLGKIRKTSIFGIYEQEVIDNFSYLTLCGLENTSNNNYDFYLPKYKMVSKTGNYFIYTFNGGVQSGIEIIG